MVRIPRTLWLAVAVAAAALTAAASAGPVLALVVTAVAVTAGTAQHATALIRLALRIHARHRPSFGPCRGAGFLGMGVLCVGTGVFATGVAEILAGPATAALVATAATLIAAPTYLLGLLLLPGTAPTLDARLRRLLDGLGVGISLLYTAWLVMIEQSGPGTLAVTTTCCITVSTALITALRAVRHRPAAVACSGGSALSILGIGTFAIALTNHAAPGWLAVAGVLLLAGPFLVVAGARRADDAPAPPHAADTTGTLAGYPVLVVPALVAVAATAYHLLTGGTFDRTSIALAVTAFGAVVLREMFAAHDIRRYARRLASQEAHFRTLVAGSSDVTVVLDGDLVVRWQSPAAARQFGLSDQDVLGRPFTELLHPDDAAATNATLQAALAGRAHGLVQARLHDGFGRWRDTESTVSDQRAAPEVAGLVVHVRDVSDRTQLQRTLDVVTWTDDLTSLANRRKFRASVTDARHATSGTGALLVVELDRFSSVNDLHGPAIGDAVLVEVARRLRAGVGPTDVPARLTADTFAVLTDAPLVHAFALATRLATTLAEPFALPGGRTVRLAADIGVADLHGGDSADDVLRHADLARRRARQLGRGRVECYDESFEAALLRRTELEQELPGVVGRGELDLVFQPVLELAYHQPVGVEALLRWRHPRLGPVPPKEFLPVAEELGLIEEIGVWSLHRACRQLSQWRRDGRDLWMSVNVSARQLNAHGFLTAVDTALDTHCVPPESIIIEVAETALPDDGTAIDRLAGLRALGVRTAIDHFGTGPTALAHLRRLPVDVLKIDRALFSEPAGQTGPATPIVDVVVALAKRLGITVVAADLETEAHVEVVRAAGCQFGQGFLLARPDHAEHIEAFLESHRAPSL